MLGFLSPLFGETIVTAPLPPSFSRRNKIHFSFSTILLPFYYFTGQGCNEGGVEGRKKNQSLKDIKMRSKHWGRSS